MTKGLQGAAVAEAPVELAEQVSANSVAIIGTLVGEASWRELSDGEQLEFRVAVPRSPSGKDVIECIVAPGKLATRLASLKPGRHVSIKGQLRSRYWSAGGKVVCRMQVRVDALRVLPK